MVSHADSEKPRTLSDDEAAWLMAITQVLTIQDMFEVVPELLEHILATRRNVPKPLAHNMHDAVSEDGLHTVLGKMISMSKEAHKD
jgi:predicted component of type VI protein secretion system